ncbi:MULTISPECIES: hypothetical protein [Microbacterium]|nr:MULTISPECIES: hypothetical protein [Microbacterium]
MITSIIHVTTTATVHLGDSFPEILDHIRRQVSAALPSSARAV